MNNKPIWYLVSNLKLKRAEKKTTLNVYSILKYSLKTVAKISMQNVTKYHNIYKLKLSVRGREFTL